MCDPDPILAVKSRSEKVHLLINGVTLCGRDLRVSTLCSPNTKITCKTCIVVANSLV